MVQSYSLALFLIINLIISYHFLYQYWTNWSYNSLDLEKMLFCTMHHVLSLPLSDDAGPIMSIQNSQKLIDTKYVRDNIYAYMSL